MNAKPTIVRVTVEWSDRTEVLEGEEAERWREATTNQAVFCHAHGMSFPDLAWKRSTSARPPEKP